jgi:hypothetical protein
MARTTSETISLASEEAGEAACKEGLGKDPNEDQRDMWLF